MNNLIPTRLKMARERAGLTVDQVSAMLSQRGHSISIKTLYGYEVGVSSPKISTFMTLCEIYGISDLLGEFGYAQPSPPTLRLSAHEHELILAYRSRPDMQPAVDTLLGITSAASQSKNA